MDHPLIFPMLIQMGMSLMILLWLAYSRVSRISKQGIAEIRKTGFPVHVNNASDNFKNQFEVPVIFYVLSLLIIVTGAQTSVIITAAWVFVIGRIIHAFIQLTKNVIFPWRFGVFVITVLALIIMLISFTLQVI
ncbi:MAPEG family protein [Litorimonas sp. RW-G-Af-16]|uniref:MAPEG family protein n=1 Tax=Litorimonas sp. RW-G-Af-16 TaxID=3241168 RepID=UPI00390CBCD9